MDRTLKGKCTIAVAVIALTLGIYGAWEKTGTTPSKAIGSTLGDSSTTRVRIGSAEVHHSLNNDVSQRLSSASQPVRRSDEAIEQSTQAESRDVRLTLSSPPVAAASAAIEQTAQGPRP